jgi:quercetin dioxygenase-like cupin family protein
MLFIDCPQTIEKDWGRELVLVNTPLYCGKLLIIDPGRQCSLHYHWEKHETFVLQRGEVLIQLGLEWIKLRDQGRAIQVPPRIPHRFGSIDGAELLEVSTCHRDEDVLRLEPSRSFLPGDWPHALETR